MDQKLQLSVAEGTNQVEVIIREGEATKVLDPKPPVKIDIKGVLNVPHEYLLKRLDKDQFSISLCHLIVDRESIAIRLVINEDDEYKRGIVIGSLRYNPKFVEFGINLGKVWTPSELGMFFKMNRAFFKDRQENMKLVTDLMNFTGTVNNRIERSVKENGDRTENFAQVVNSNLPKSFTIELPIFKGMKAESVEVETFAQINGRDVAFILISPGASQTMEDIRDKAIDDQLKLIREIAPDLAILEE